MRPRNMEIEQTFDGIDSTGDSIFRTVNCVTDGLFNGIELVGYSGNDISYHSRNSVFDVVPCVLESSP